MPHITLEYTANIRSHVDPKATLRGVASALMAHCECKPEDIKARARAFDDYFVGSGEPENAFVYVRVALLEGRDDGTKRAVCDAILGELRGRLPAGPEKTQVCVEVTDIHKAAYVKAYAEGR